MEKICFAMKFNKLKIYIILVFMYIMDKIFVFAMSDQLCSFKYLTGFPCPACGMTRAYRFLFHGDFFSAFSYHPLFWLLPVAIVIQLYIIIKKRYISLSLWIAVVALLCITYGARMYLYFPLHEPMKLYPKGIILQIISD